MRVLGGAEIRAAISIADARNAVHDAFCALANGSVVAPDEFAMRLDHGGELHIKGAYLGGEIIAFKVATGQFPSGANAGFTSVLDAASGQPLAILDDGGWLTEMRTAAASAVSAAALARPASSRLALLGCGVQAAFQIEALRDALPIDDVSVWSRTTATAARFAEEHDAVAAPSVAAAVVGADIVVCCTPSREPLVSLDMVAPGTHIVAMGADMKGKRELSSDVLQGCDLLVCDDVDVARRVGELQHAPEQVDRAVNLGDVLVGRRPARTSEQHVSVADLCGLGIQDAALAQLVMQRCSP